MILKLFQFCNIISFMPFMLRAATYKACLALYYQFLANVKTVQACQGIRRFYLKKTYLVPGLDVPWSQWLADSHPDQRKHCKKSGRPIYHHFKQLASYDSSASVLAGCWVSNDKASGTSSTFELLFFPFSWLFIFWFLLVFQYCTQALASTSCN